jgi:hypothetical protein
MLRPPHSGRLRHSRRVTIVKKARLWVKAQVMSALYAAAIVGSIGCSAWSWTSCAHAQKAVLGPAQADVGGDSVRKLASEALGEALRMQGLTVLYFEEAKKALPRGESCDDACAARLLRVVSADLSAVVKITGNEQGLPNLAQVNLQDAAGHHFEGTAAVRDGDVRDATTRALLEARSYQLLGPGPWLRVEGTPEGADVLVDGSVVGKLPYRASIVAGRHQLIVRDAGYSRFEQTLDVPAEDGRKLKVQVALEPAPIEAPGAALEASALAQTNASSDRDSSWLVLPITMGVLGVGLATVASVRLASRGDSCVQPDAAGRCIEKRGVRVWPTVGTYALSAALIGAGIVWIVLGSQEEERAHLAANIGIDHVSIAGSF